MPLCCLLSSKNLCSHSLQNSRPTWPNTSGLPIRAASSIPSPPHPASLLGLPSLKQASLSPAQGLCPFLDTHMSSSTLLNSLSGRPVLRASLPVHPPLHAHLPRLHFPSEDSSLIRKCTPCGLLIICLVPPRYAPQKGRHSINIRRTKKGRLKRTIPPRD